MAVRRRSATSRASNSARSSGVCRARVPGPTRLRQMLLRSIPRQLVLGPNQRVVRGVGDDEGPGGVEDGDGYVGQPVEQALHAGRDARRHDAESGRGMPGQPEQEVALGRRTRAARGLAPPRPAPTVTWPGPVRAWSDSRPRSRPARRALLGAALSRGGERQSRRRPTRAGRGRANAAPSDRTPTGPSLYCA